MNVIVCLDDKNGMLFNKRRQSQDKINTLIIYKWNRIYPADLHFDINVNDVSWELIDSEEFNGSSHEKITREIYRRTTNEKTT